MNTVLLNFLIFYSGGSGICRDAERSVLAAGAPPVQPQNVSDHQQRFIGGGFNLSRTQHPNRLAAAGGPGGGGTL